MRTSRTVTSASKGRCKINNAAPSNATELSEARTPKGHTHVQSRAPTSAESAISAALTPKACRDRSGDDDCSESGAEELDQVWLASLESLLMGPNSDDSDGEDCGAEAAEASHEAAGADPRPTEHPA